MTRLLPASGDKAWSAITNPAELAKWWGPEGFSCPAVEFEPRVGNAYRIAMQPPEGELFHLTGEFQEVDPHTRLAFTFIWDPATLDDRETLATLSLRERSGGTEVELSQGEFATEERRALHEEGWSAAFDRLEALLR